MKGFVCLAEGVRLTMDGGDKPPGILARISREAVLGLRCWGLLYCRDGGCQADMPGGGGGATDEREVRH